MLKVLNRIKREIAGKKCDFVKGKGTTNAIDIPRNIIERSIEQQNIHIFALLFIQKLLIKYDIGNY